MCDDGNQSDGDACNSTREGPKAMGDQTRRGLSSTLTPSATNSSASVWTEYPIGSSSASPGGERGHLIYLTQGDGPPGTFHGGLQATSA